MITCCNSRSPLLRKATEVLCQLLRAIDRQTVERPTAEVVDEYFVGQHQFRAGSLRAQTEIVIVKQTDPIPLIKSTQRSNKASLAEQTKGRQPRNDGNLSPVLGRPALGERLDSIQCSVGNRNRMRWGGVVGDSTNKRPPTGVPRRDRHERIEPTIRDNRVIVQEQDVFARGSTQPLVTTGGESTIRGIKNDFDPGWAKPVSE